MEDEDWEEYQQDEAEEEKEYSTEESSSFEEVSRVLIRSEAGTCLHMLGKCDSGIGYAYLGLNASSRNLTDISVIATFKHVIYVDVSDNRLTTEALQILSRMTYLLMLQADRNLLTSAELKPMPYLQVLTLNKNKLRDTNNISHRALERLELNHNKIETVALSSKDLGNLKTLELRGNMLTTMSDICFPNLSHLYLAQNKIETLHGLESLTNLKVLHLRHNRISNLNMFGAQCSRLSYLNLRNNKISNIAEWEKLKPLQSLETIVILGNPVLADKEDDSYRRIILVVLPHLKRIDKDPVLFEEKREAEELRMRMLQDGTNIADLDFDTDVLNE